MLKREIKMNNIILSTEYQQKLMELRDLLDSNYVHINDKIMWLESHYPELLMIDDISRITDVIEELKYQMGFHR